MYKKIIKRINHIQYILKNLPARRTLRQGWGTWHGVTLHFPPQSIIASSIFEFGFWEAEIASLLNLATISGTTILDVGANIGASAIPLLVAFPDIRVLSFEPSPTVLPSLTRTHQECQFQNRWEIISKAAIEKSGPESIFTLFNGAGADVFEGMLDTGRSGFLSRQISVPTTSVDEEWEIRGKPIVSIIKVDVEGAELRVLAGALNCLAECRPSIITEWSPKNFAAYGYHSEAILEFANSVGYQVFFIPELFPATASPALRYQLMARENLMLLPK